MIHLLNEKREGIRSAIGLIKRQMFESTNTHVYHQVYKPLKNILSVEIKTDILSVIQTVDGALEFTIWDNS